MNIKLLDSTYSNQIISLAKEVNSDVNIDSLNERLNEMFEYENCYCFGLIVDGELIGITSGWITTRFYSGRQLEIDNVIINSNIQSKGYGAKLLSHIENWAIEKGCQCIELNTYIQNKRSHKFYFNQGYEILGYHFYKKIGS